MRAAIVDREHLEIEVVRATVYALVLDARVGEMQMPVKVREVVLVRPVPNLGLVSIGPAIAVRAAPVVLLQELLILALQLAIEQHPFDVRAALAQALSLPLVRAEDLRVVLHFPRLLQIGVELLPGLTGAFGAMVIVSVLAA